MGPRYEFADFVLDPREGLLLRSNEPVKATPRLLALLEALVDRPGRLVEKQELLDRVWEGTSVGEANLTVQVSKLRRLLGETEQRVFIETVPTRGYRFLVPVRVLPAAAPPAVHPSLPMTEDALASPFFLPPAVAPPSDPRALARRPVRWGRWALAAVAVLLIAWGAYGGGVARLVGPGFWARDGGAGGTHAPDATLRLTSNVADDSEPAVSPDGRTVAFVSNRDGAPGIYLLALHRQDAPPVRVPTMGGASAPSWSPDGARLAFVCRRGGQADICVVGRDGRDERVVVAGPHDEKDPAWSPDGSRIAFASNRDGRHELYVMRTDGGALERLTRNDHDDGRPSWSPDGTTLAFVREHAGIHDIYTIDVATRRERLLTPEPGSDSEPAWSPDGTRIAFASARSGDYEIYVMQADGSHQVAITRNPARDTRPAWSPDGRDIVFASNRSTVHFADNDLFITAADGASPARRLTHAASDAHGAGAGRRAPARVWWPISS